MKLDRFARRPQVNTQNNVINRGELPIVSRGGGGGSRGHGTSLHPGRLVSLLILAVVAFLIFQYRPALRLPLDAVTLVNLADFRVESVSTMQTAVGDVTNWQVTGRLMNASGGVVPLPDLHVRLVRPDGSLAGETRLSLGAGELEAGETRRFLAKLQTGSRETVRAEVTPVPARGEEAP